MSPPPNYADLGKDARELFTKHYHIGLVKLDCKVKSSTGVNFNAVSSIMSETGKATGFLEMKYKMADYGVTMKEKWTTDNTLNTEIFSEDRLLTGLKLTSKLSIAPQLSKVNLVAGAGYKREQFHATADVDYSPGGSLFNASLVHTFRGFLTGCQLGFRSAVLRPSKVNLLCGYSGSDLLMILSANDLKEYGLLVHHHVRPNVQGAASVHFDSATSQTVFSIGGIFTINKESTLRAKFSNVGLLGLSLTHRLRDGIDVTMCAAVNIKNYEKGGHQFGLGVNLEA